MIEPEVVAKLKKKYNAVDPMVFARCVERANSPGELFDILESLPTTLPVVWDEKARRFVSTGDLTQSGEMQFPE
jgi:hypothetical protein